MKRICLALASAVSCGLIASCGGGGGGGDKNEISEGIYLGLSADNRAIVASIESGGNYNFFYTGTDPQQTDLIGAGQGTFTAADGNFSTQNSLVFDGMGSGTKPVAISGTYKAAKSITGTASGNPAFNGAFSLNYSKSLSETPANISLVAGAYSGRIANASIPSTGQPLSIVVDSSGNITGNTTLSCTVSGNISTTSTGSTYRVALQFGNACPVDANQSFNGTALFSGSALAGLAQNADRSNAVIFDIEK